VSLRLFGVSTSLSVSCFFLVYGLLAELAALSTILGSVLGHHALPTQTYELVVLLSVGFLFLALACLCALLAVLPARSGSPVLKWAACFPILLILSMLSRQILLGRLSAKLGVIFLAVAMNLALDILFVILVRGSLRWILERSDFSRVAVAATFQILVCATLFVIPAYSLAVGQLANSSSIFAVGLAMLTILNIPTALASISFLLLLTVVLMHRITWPVLSAWTRPLTRSEVLDKRKTVRSIASYLIIYGLHGFPTLWSSALAILQAGK
jgi:hypothetical protein